MMRSVLRVLRRW